MREHFGVGRNALRSGENRVVHFTGEIAREGLGVLQNEGDFVENRVQSVQRGVFDALFVGDVGLKTGFGVFVEHGEVAKRGECREKLSSLYGKREEKRTCVSQWMKTLRRR